MRAIRKRSKSVAGLVAGAVLAVLAVAGNSAAERIEFPLAQVRLITSDAGAARILLDPGDISVLDGELVTSAFLRMPLPGELPDQDLDVVVYALDTAWAGQDARWNTPWSRPGGDLDATYAHTVRLGKERVATSLVIDVTLMVQEMADGVSGKHGFLLTVPRSRGDGFTAANRQLLGSPESGKLEVTFRRITELGFTEGSLSVVEE
jgi:hypothetical protein